MVGVNHSQFSISGSHIGSITLRHLEPIPVRTELLLVRQAERIEFMRAQVDIQPACFISGNTYLGSRYGTASLLQLLPMPDSSVELNVTRS